MLAYFFAVGICAPNLDIRIFPENDAIQCQGG